MEQQTEAPRWHMARWVSNTGDDQICFTLVTPTVAATINARGNIHLSPLSEFLHNQLESARKSHEMNESSKAAGQGALSLEDTYGYE